MHRLLCVPAVALVALAVSGCARPADLATRPFPEPPISAWTSPSASPSAPAPTCSAAGTRLTAGEVDGAMGLRAMGVDLVNCGEGTVVLDGYPAARLFDKDHDALTVRVDDGVGAVTHLPPWELPPTKVTLGPGESATSLVVWRNLTEFAPDGPVNAAFLDLAPVPGGAFEPVAMTSVIDLGTTGRLAVSPWVAATPGTL